MPIFSTYPSVSNLLACLTIFGPVLFMVQLPTTMAMVNSIYNYPIMSPGATSYQGVTYHPVTSLPLAQSYIPGLAPFGATAFIHPLPSHIHSPVAPGVFSTIPAILNAQRTPSTMTLTVNNPDCEDCLDDPPTATVTLSKLVNGKKVTQQSGTATGKSPVTSLLVTDPVTGMTTMQNSADETPTTITLTLTAPKMKPGDTNGNKRATATVVLTVPPPIASTPIYLPTTPVTNSLGQQVFHVNGVPSLVANPGMLVPSTPTVVSTPTEVVASQPSSPMIGTPIRMSPVVDPSILDE